MVSKIKTYPVFTKAERGFWDEKMGKNFIKAGNFRKTNKDRIKFGQYKSLDLPLFLFVFNNELSKYLFLFNLRL